MDTTRLSSKGQVIIPKDVRDAKGWKPGDEFVVESRPDGVLLKRRKPFKTTTLDEVVGSGGYKGPPLSIEEMNAAVDEMFRREWKRKKR
ncbi:MAG: AbrB/MazE/SpoVT family DNA-binding domain-containing protein [Pseudomonadota bacterium]